MLQQVTKKCLGRLPSSDCRKVSAPWKELSSREHFPKLELQAPSPLLETLGARCVSDFFKIQEDDMLHILCILHKVANLKPGSESGLRIVFENKVLSVRSYARLFQCWPWVLLATAAQLSGQRTQAHKA